MFVLKIKYYVTSFKIKGRKDIITYIRKLILKEKKGIDVYVIYIMEKEKGRFYLVSFHNPSTFSKNPPTPPPSHRTRPLPSHTPPPLLYSLSFSFTCQSGFFSPYPLIIRRKIRNALENVNVREITREIFLEKIIYFWPAHSCISYIFSSIL